MKTMDILQAKIDTVPRARVTTRNSSFSPKLCNVYLFNGPQNYTRSSLLIYKQKTSIICCHSPV